MKKILFAASEALPFASTGGLADVLGSLPREIAERGADVRVVLPLYGIISGKYRDMMTLEAEITVKLSWRNQYCGIYSLKYGGVTFYFIDNEYYFKRSSMYGSYDDGERYAFFCLAILEMMPHIGFYPDILHANDWQTALAVIYLKCCYDHLAEYRNIKAIYTIHNIGYQGIYDIDIMGDIFGLDASLRGIVEYDGALNLTKGAIVCCDRLTTVSPRYAEEIQSEPHASGLHYIINDAIPKLSGILNGIDYEYYDPSSDPDLTCTFDAESLEGKAENKAALQAELGLPVRGDVPIIAMITRLVSHKGIDLVEAISEELISEDIQLVVLGTGDLAYERYFEGMAQRHPDKAAVLIRYDKELSKRIYAGSDIFLMPSKSEPCGLAQMIASRYGTVAVVRETGGLYDSIKPLNEYTGEGNGFTFTNYNAHDMLYTIRRAIGFFHDKDKWRTLMRKAMYSDFSWESSAREYMKLYDALS